MGFDKLNQPARVRAVGLDRLNQRAGPMLSIDEVRDMLTHRPVR